MEGQVNIEKTQQAKQSLTYIRYCDWMKEHGCISPRIDFPVAFWKQGTIGCLAKQDIPSNSVFMFTPLQISINLAAAYNSKISHLFSSYPCFQKHTGAVDNVLIAFLIYQRMKDKQSFWYPYIQTVLNIQSLADWSQLQTNQLQDKVLVFDYKKWEKRMKKSLDSLFQVFIDNPQFFPQADYSLLLKWAWKLICTRSFAQDGGMLIPLADNFNHGNFHIRYQTQRKTLLQESRHIGVLDYRDLDNQIHTPTRPVPKNAPPTNKLQKYLEKAEFPFCNTIWELQEVLEAFQSSSDDENIRNYGDMASDEEICSTEYRGKTVQQFQQYYFFKATAQKTGFLKGEQVFSSYGRLSNRDLILDYGFAVANNKFDAVYFRMWKPRTGRIGLFVVEDILSENYKEQMECFSLDWVSELFSLKKRHLNTEIFTYFRKTLGQRTVRLVASPSNIRFELQIIQNILKLYQILMLEYPTSLEEDLALIQKAEGRFEVALVYRIGQKEIIQAQIKYLKRLEKVLKVVMLGDIEEHIQEHTEEELREVYVLKKYMKSLRANLYYQK